MESLAFRFGPFSFGLIFLTVSIDIVDKLFVFVVISLDLRSSSGFSQSQPAVDLSASSSADDSLIAEKTPEVTAVLFDIGAPRPYSASSNN